MSPIGLVWVSPTTIPNQAAQPNYRFAVCPPSSSSSPLSSPLLLPAAAADFGGQFAIADFNEGKEPTGDSLRSDLILHEALQEGIHLRSVALGTHLPLYFTQLNEF